MVLVTESEITGGAIQLAERVKSTTVRRSRNYSWTLATGAHLQPKIEY